MQVDRAHPHQAEAEGHHDAQRGAAAAPDQQQQQQQQQQGVVVCAGHSEYLSTCSLVTVWVEAVYGMHCDDVRCET